MVEGDAALTRFISIGMSIDFAFGNDLSLSMTTHPLRPVDPVVQTYPPSMNIRSCMMMTV